MKSDKEILTELNKMKAQRELWKDKQVKELVKLETLEEKIQYWEVNLKYTSLLRPISNGTDTINLSLEAKINRETRLLLLKAEIKRLENTNDLLSHRLREDFVLLASETNNIKLTKKKFIERVSKLIDIDTYKDLRTQMRKLGFETYKGGRKPDTIVKELNRLSIEINHQLMFKDIYEGYKLAELKEDIKDTKNVVQNNQVSTNYIGLFIHAFGLENSSIFSDLKYGNTDKAKLFAKLFNLRETDSENLRKAIYSPNGKVSKPFLNWFKQFGIDPKDTHLNKYLPK
tara:strand:- start:118 stop:975 length:858 start_codon:yes stop_codon:yes gene_type:complete